MRIALLMQNKKKWGCGTLLIGKSLWESSPNTGRIGADFSWSFLGKYMRNKVKRRLRHRIFLAGQMSQRNLSCQIWWEFLRQNFFQKNDFGPGEGWFTNMQSSRSQLSHPFYTSHPHHRPYGCGTLPRVVARKPIQMFKALHIHGGHLPTSLFSGVRYGTQSLRKFESNFNRIVPLWETCKYLLFLYTTW